MSLPNSTTFTRLFRVTYASIIIISGQPDDALAPQHDRPLPEDVRSQLLGERHPGGHALELRRPEHQAEGELAAAHQGGVVDGRVQQTLQEGE